MRDTPTMAADVMYRLWSMEDAVELLDAREDHLAERGLYKLRQTKTA